MQAHDLLREREFAQFLECPAIAEHAVRNHRGDARAFLRYVIKVSREIKGEAEFAPFREMPWSIPKTVAWQPSYPRSFLRYVLAVAKEILDDPEFGYLDSLGLACWAVWNQPDDPRALLRATGVIYDMMGEREFIPFRRTRWLLQRAVLANPNDPRGWLRKFLATVRQIQQEPEFARFSFGAVRWPVLECPGDPRGFLRQLRG
jgi:hypothetical protein